MVRRDGVRDVDLRVRHERRDDGDDRRHARPDRPPGRVPPSAIVHTAPRQRRRAWLRCRYEGHGLRFPAIEAMRCLRAGETESPLLPHAATLAVMTTMDEIRGQIGVSYPADAA